MSVSDWGRRVRSYLVCGVCVCVSAGKNVYMLASTVSSKFLQRMASVEGFQFEVCVYTT